jgi:glycosyltransferase involved in cell wall biosynthesis
MLADYLVKVPMVVTFHGNEVINIPDLTRVGGKGYTKTEVTWMKKIIHRLLRRADHITAVSDELLSSASRHQRDIQIKSTRIFMGGFDLQKPSELAVRPWDRAPFILAVGRLAVEKGFDWLLDAFKKVLEMHMKLSLIIIGEGSERDLLLKKIEDLQLKERVFLQGALPKEEIKKYYQNCLFVVVPSRWEGLPTVILEAFSFGKAVVASAVGAIPEVVTEGITGVLVEKENISQLADAIEKLLSDTPLKDELGANARTFMKETGGWQKSAQKYYEIYERVLTAK